MSDMNEMLKLALEGSVWINPVTYVDLNDRYGVQWAMKKLGSDESVIGVKERRLYEKTECGKISISILPEHFKVRELATNTLWECRGNDMRPVPDFYENNLNEQQGKSMSNFSIEDKKKFVELVEPLQRWLKKFHPHISVIVNNQTAEILEGICAFDNSISGGVDMAINPNKSDNRDMLDSLYLVLGLIETIPNKTTKTKDEKIAVFLL